MTLFIRRLRAALLAGLLALQAAGCVTGGKPAPTPAAATLPAQPAPTPAEPFGGKESYRVRLSMDERTVELLGVMTPKAVFDLEYLIRRHATVETLRLTSPGGVVGPSLGLAELVAERGLTVYVPLYCASACSLVLAAGRERLLAPDAQLGYHSASGPLGDQAMAEALAGYGLPAAFIARIQSTPHDDIWRPTLEELRAAGAITGVAPDPAPPRLASDAAELAGWAVGRDALLDAFGAAFPERLPAVRAATLAHLAGGPGSAAALEAVAASIEEGLIVALPRASDQALRAFYTLLRDGMAAVRSEAPRLCFGVADAASAATLDPALLDRQAERKLEVMTLVFRSYAERPVTVDRARLRQRLESFVVGLYSDGVVRDSDVDLLGNPERNPRRFCDVMTAILDAALRDPDATDALRGLALAAEGGGP